jgi:lipopolysaccharide export system permease protein
MMTSGASLRRIGTGFLLIAVLLSVLQFLFNEYGAAWCSDHARRIMEIEIKKRQPSVRGPSWRFLRGAESRFYYYRFFDPKSEVINQIEVFQAHEDGRTLKQLIVADAAFYQDGEWTFLNGEIQEMENNAPVRSEAFGNLTIALPETPEDFARLSPHPREMSFSQLLDYVKVMISSGEDPSSYLPELHLKIAFPLSCIVFTFIALSISFRMKAVNLSFEIGAAVAVAFLYYFLIGVLTELGRNEHLAPWLAGWGALLVYGPVSFIFFWFTRTDYS